MSGQLSDRPKEIFEQMLIDLSLGVAADGSTAWSIYYGMPDGSDVPDNVLSLRDSEPQILDRDHFFNVHEDEGLQLTVRSDGQSAGDTKIEAIKAALDAVSRREVVVGDNTYLVHSWRRVSGPIEVGFASQTDRRTLFTLNGYIKLEQLN